MVKYEPARLELFVRCLKSNGNMAKFNDQKLIIELEANEVFVFGSNLNGIHQGGAARQASEQFGAIWGIGVGMAGQTYAIPTMSPLTLKEIAYYIGQFVEYAKLTPDKKYLVTAIATGIAGYSRGTMDEIWSRWESPVNVIRV